MTRDELYARVPLKFLQNPEAQTWLYGIVCKPFIKIGIAQDLSRRVEEMRLMNPHPIRVALKAQVSSCLALMAEGELHRLFAEVRYRREWFRATAKDVAPKFWEIVEQAREIEDAYYHCLSLYQEAGHTANRERMLKGLVGNYGQVGGARARYEHSRAAQT